MPGPKSMTPDGERLFNIALAIGCAGYILYQDAILAIPLLGLIGALLRYKEVELLEK